MPHTPGPWKVDQGIGGPIIEAGRRRIADVTMDGNDTMHNANLIAAAPLQNEALRMVLSYWLNKRATNEEYRLVLAKVNAAIAAAEGGEA